MSNTSVRETYMKSELLKLQPKLQVANESNSAQTIFSMTNIQLVTL